MFFFSPIFIFSRSFEQTATDISQKALPPPQTPWISFCGTYLCNYFQSQLKGQSDQHWKSFYSHSEQIFFFFLSQIVSKVPKDLSLKKKKKNQRESWIKPALFGGSMLVKILQQNVLKTKQNCRVLKRCSARVPPHHVTSLRWSSWSLIYNLKPPWRTWTSVAHFGDVGLLEKHGKKKKIDISPRTGTCDNDKCFFYTFPGTKQLPQSWNVSNLLPLIPFCECFLRVWTAKLLLLRRRTHNPAVCWHVFSFLFCFLTKSL